jgi:Transport protein Trs120 or TRAPPC9, TRAPP II complex subunit
LIVFNYEYGLTLSPSRTKKSEDLPILRPLRDDSESLIICPSEGGNSETSPLRNGKTYNTSPSVPISVVESKLKSMLGNVALKVFDSLQREMMNCDDAKTAGTFPQWLLTATRRVRPKANDEPNSLAAGAGSGVASVLNAAVPNIKKLQSGRLRKFMGDLCMQVCSPVDALAHYSAAIADGRQCSDSLWLAGSLEGYAAAILTLLGSKPSAGAVYSRSSEL